MAVPDDVIQTHILPRLDGPTLASAASASVQLTHLCDEEKLWENLCRSTWPSVSHPRVQEAISTFPAGYRSFFSDSSSSIDPHGSRLNHQPQSPELISAVDLHYREKPVFSKVEVTETQSAGFLSSSLWIDLGPNDSAFDRPDPDYLKNKCEVDDGLLLSDLEENMTLSWIMIDPTRNRSANLSSLRPVSVRRHWMTGDVQLLYATILARDHVQCRIVVTCGGKEVGEVHVREVRLQLQDMDGYSLRGKDSLVILQEAMESGRRKKVSEDEEEERYEEFLQKKRERKKERQMKERRWKIVDRAVEVMTVVDLILWIIWFLFY